MKTYEEELEVNLYKADEHNKSMLVDLIKDVKEMYNHTSYDSYHDDEYGPPRYYVYVEELEILEVEYSDLAYELAVDAYTNGYATR